MIPQKVTCSASLTKKKQGLDVPEASPVAFAQTFRPSKTKYKNEQLSKIKETNVQTLGSGDMAQAVKLPDGESVNEWLAVNTVDFFNELNLIYGTVQQACTDKTCPTMSAGSQYQYLWQDANRYPTPTELSATQYVDLLMEWAESQINDDNVFPLTPGSAFPRDFKKRVSTIFRRFFRVYAHIYHCHLDDIRSFNADQHLHTCFKHFLFFCLEFGLVPEQELDALKPVIESMTAAKK